MMRSFRTHIPLVFVLVSCLVTSCTETFLANNDTASPAKASQALDSVASAIDLPKADTSTENLTTVDTADYNARMLTVSNNDKKGKWPAKNSPYPLPGALLPYTRIVAFYGNLYSKRMGILGELPKDAMLKKLQEEVAKWQAADSSIPVIPALHYIAVTAQGTAGADNKYRLRMPFKQIDTVMKWAAGINAQVFLDVQTAHSTLQAEIPRLEPYLKLPGVQLGIDPEFSLKNGEVPGSRIGSFNDSDINFVIDYLTALVKKNNLPPKILVIHRFTQGMLTGYDRIKKTPQVQVVIDMDGWGNKILKKSSWMRYIYNEPVQFAGFKLFYKNDLKKNAVGLYTPEELLKFTPKPMYIQYQ